MKRKLSLVISLAMVLLLVSPALAVDMIKFTPKPADLQTPTPEPTNSRVRLPDIRLPDLTNLLTPTPVPRATPTPRRDIFIPKLPRIPIQLSTPTPQPTDHPDKPKTQPQQGHEFTSFGLYFREMRPKLTDEWYMFTPIDLGVEGLQSYPLVADNAWIIGEMRVTIQNGMVTVDYEVANGVRVGREFYTFFPYLDAVQTVNVSLLAGQAFPFRQPISIQDTFGSDAKVIIYLNCTADFSKNLPGITPFNPEAFRPWMRNMLLLLD